MTPVHYLAEDALDYALEQLLKFKQCVCYAVI